jgi:hypothetical protein
MYEKLEEIYDLKEKGLLSDSEFALKKKKILDELTPSQTQTKSLEHDTTDDNNVHDLEVGIIITFAIIIIITIASFVWYRFF